MGARSYVHGESAKYVDVSVGVGGKWTWGDINKFGQDAKGNGSGSDRSWALREGLRARMVGMLGIWDSPTACICRLDQADASRLETSRYFVVQQPDTLIKPRKTTSVHRHLHNWLRAGPGS